MLGIGGPGPVGAEDAEGAVAAGHIAALVALQEHLLHLVDVSAVRAEAERRRTGSYSLESPPCHNQPGGLRGQWTCECGSTRGGRRHVWIGKIGELEDNLLQPDKAAVQFSLWVWSLAQTDAEQTGRRQISVIATDLETSTVGVALGRHVHRTDLTLVDGEVDIGVRRQVIPGHRSRRAAAARSGHGCLAWCRSGRPVSRRCRCSCWKRRR